MLYEVIHFDLMIDCLEDKVGFRRSRWFVLTRTDTLKKILLYNRVFFFEE